MHDQSKTPEHAPGRDQDPDRDHHDLPDPPADPQTPPIPEDEDSPLDEAMPDVAVNNSVSSEHPGGQ